MLGNLTLFFAFIVNFISFVLLGLLFQQITKYKLSLKRMDFLFIWGWSLITDSEWYFSKYTKFKFLSG